MNQIFVVILLGFFSLIISWGLYPLALRFAVRHNIFDNPDARKLQCEPVPVFGGAAVGISIIITGLIAAYLFHDTKDWALLIAIILMLAIGITDDIHSLSARLRFLLECIIMLGLIYGSELAIALTQGLFGVNILPPYIAIPLSIIAGVGILNSINFIDGIDGYSSGFSIIAFALFASIFFVYGNIMMAAICIIAIGALVPFFCHNALIKKGKMYIGDGGTMLMGMLLTYCVFTLTDASAENLVRHSHFGAGAFCMAVLAIPVFDTLRVMTTRLCHGISPFHPDKTHLHHLYIENGFTHLQTTIIILITNTLIVAAWAIAWLLGASPVAQFTIVILLGILVTFVYYPVAKKYQFLKH